MTTDIIGCRVIANLKTSNINMSIFIDALSRPCSAVVLRRNTSNFCWNKTTECWKLTSSWRDNLSIDHWHDDSLRLWSHVRHFSDDSKLDCSCSGDHRHFHYRSLSNWPAIDKLLDHRVGDSRVIWSLQLHCSFDDVLRELALINFDNYLGINELLHRFFRDNWKEINKLGYTTRSRSLQMYN